MPVSRMIACSAKGAKNEVFVRAVRLGAMGRDRRICTINVSLV